ncbi:MAG TPA: hypothetical protein H9694_10185 [Firmicutes bacterium]|nr:hypothetical protein [Bacillota bacterium]
MNILWHYPKDEQDVKALQQKVAEVHAEARDRFTQKGRYALDKAREISAESGLLEETEEDEKAYKQLRWAMMKERIHGQPGQAGIPIRPVWMLVDRAEQEFKSYIQSVIQLSAREICDRSMEIGAKESLLRSFICQAGDLREEILRRIMDEKEPLNTLYQSMQAKGNTWQMLEGSLRNTLEMYNRSFPEQISRTDILRL